MSSFLDFSDLDDALAGAGTAPMSMAEARRRASMVNGGESAMVPCPKCGGSGMTRWGRCFACQGKGKRTVRSVAASKGVQTAKRNREAAMAAFEFDGVNADVTQFLEANRDWSDFFRSLSDQLRDGRPLTDNQVDAVRRSMAKIAANKAARADARKAAAPVVEISAIQKLFETALSSGLKRPVFRAGALEISTDRNAGAATLWVRSNGSWQGKVEGGKWNAFRAAQPETLPTLEAVAADPLGQAKLYGKLTGSCSCCGRELTDPESVAAGIGPICARKWGL